MNTDTNRFINAWEDILRQSTYDEIAAMRRTFRAIDDPTNVISPIWTPHPDVWTVDMSFDLINKITDNFDKFIVLMGHAVDHFDVDNQQGRELYETVSNFFGPATED